MRKTSCQSTESSIGKFALIQETSPGREHYEHPSINDVMFIEHNQNGDGHIIPDYFSILNTGIAPAMRRVEIIFTGLDYSDDEYLSKKAFLESVIISLNGIIEYSNRIANLAEEKADKAVDTVRKQELLRISEACRRVPENKPGTFFEALQLILILHTAIQVESNGHSISLGRMDSYLYPFYLEEIEKGSITDSEVQELFECFLLKCFEANKLRDCLQPRSSAETRCFRL